MEKGAKERREEEAVAGTRKTSVALSPFALFPWFSKSEQTCADSVASQQHHQQQHRFNGWNLE